ncbi:MAG: hypothetical protein KC713_03300, partial [Candidatus Omnitrophica bacterium]|nr:hypothetical protein [Candidatus Omnitrophota bacterium]
QSMLTNPLNLPAIGTMLPTSGSFDPVMLKGLTLDPENALQFEFLIDRGEESVSDDQLKDISLDFAKYFLTALTVPEKDMWVNLSPYEEERITTEAFGQTLLGRDLLAQDYLLKQLTASLMYPEGETGKRFWEKIYQRAYEQFGTTDVPVNTFNKVWIMPDKATIIEKDLSAYVVAPRMKVMTEADFLAKQESQQMTEDRKQRTDDLQSSDINHLSSEIIKEVILPVIEEEINTGKNFAKLRQIYNAMVLATWFKISLKESLLGQIYVDQTKTKGVDLNDKDAKQKIYDQYIAAFKKGVYDYIQEDYDPAMQQVVTRKYISGGYSPDLMMAMKNNIFRMDDRLPPDVKNGAIAYLGGSGAASDSNFFTTTFGVTENPDTRMQKSAQPFLNRLDDISGQEKGFLFLEGDTQMQGRGNVTVPGIGIRGNPVINAQEAAHIRAVALDLRHEILGLISKAQALVEQLDPDKPFEEQEENLKDLKEIFDGISDMVRVKGTENFPYNLGEKMHLKAGLNIGEFVQSAGLDGTLFALYTTISAGNLFLLTGEPQNGLAPTHPLSTVWDISNAFNPLSGNVEFALNSNQIKREHITAFQKGINKGKAALLDSVTALAQPFSLSRKGLTSGSPKSAIVETLRPFILPVDLKSYYSKKNGVFIGPGYLINTRTGRVVQVLSRGVMIRSERLKEDGWQVFDLSQEEEAKAVYHTINKIVLESVQEPGIYEFNEDGYLTAMHHESINVRDILLSIGINNEEVTSAFNEFFKNRNAFSYEKLVDVFKNQTVIDKPEQLIVLVTEKLINTQYVTLERPQSLQQVKDIAEMIMLSTAEREKFILTLGDQDTTAKYRIRSISVDDYTNDADNPAVDLVLTLPDGTQTTVTFRADPNHPNQPITMVTDDPAFDKFGVFIGNNNSLVIKFSDREVYRYEPRLSHHDTTIEKVSISELSTDQYDVTDAWQSDAPDNMDLDSLPGNVQNLLAYLQNPGVNNTGYKLSELGSLQMNLIALKNSEDAIQQVVENNGIIVFNDGRILRGNEKTPLPVLANDESISVYALKGEISGRLNAIFIPRSRGDYLRKYRRETAVHLANNKDPNVQKAVAQKVRNYLASQQALQAGDPKKQGMYSSAIGDPTGEESGTSVSIDMSGSGVLVTVNRYEGGKRVGNKDKARVFVPWTKADKIGSTPQQLMKKVAKTVKTALNQTDATSRFAPISLSFGFAFAATILEANKAVAGKMSKGFKEDLLEGMEVGQLLLEALDNENITDTNGNPIDLQLNAIYNDTRAVHQLLVGAIIAMVYSSGFNTTLRLVIDPETGEVEIYNSESGAVPIGQIINAIKDDLEIKGDLYSTAYDLTNQTSGEVNRLESLITGSHLGKSIAAMIQDMMDNVGLLEELKDTDRFRFVLRTLEPEWLTSFLRKQKTHTRRAAMSAYFGIPQEAIYDRDIISMQSIAAALLNNKDRSINDIAEELMAQGALFSSPLTNTLFHDRLKLIDTAWFSEIWNSTQPNPGDQISTDDIKKAVFKVLGFSPENLTGYDALELFKIAEDYFDRSTNLAAILTTASLMLAFPDEKELQTLLKEKGLQIPADSSFIEKNPKILGLLNKYLAQQDIYGGHADKITFIPLNKMTSQGGDLLGLRQQQITQQEIRKIKYNSTKVVEILPNLDHKISYVREAAQEELAKREDKLTEYCETMPLADNIRLLSKFHSDAVGKVVKNQISNIQPGNLIDLLESITDVQELTSLHGILFELNLEENLPEISYRLNDLNTNYNMWKADWEDGQTQVLMRRMILAYFLSANERIEELENLKKMNVTQTNVQSAKILNQLAFGISDISGQSAHNQLFIYRDQKSSIVKRRTAIGVLASSGQQEALSALEEELARQKAMTPVPETDYNAYNLENLIQFTQLAIRHLKRILGDQEMRNKRSLTGQEILHSAASYAQMVFNQLNPTFNPEGNQPAVLSTDRTPELIEGFIMEGTGDRVQLPHLLNNILEYQVDWFNQPHENEFFLRDLKEQFKILQQTDFTSAAKENNIRTPQAYVEALKGKIIALFHLESFPEEDKSTAEKILEKIFSMDFINSLTNLAQGQEKIGQDIQELSQLIARNYQGAVVKEGSSYTIHPHRIATYLRRVFYLDGYLRLVQMGAISDPTIAAKGTSSEDTIKTLALEMKTYLHSLFGLNKEFEIDELAGLLRYYLETKNVGNTSVL